MRMCSHPTSDFCKSRNHWVSNHTCGKHLLSDPQPTYQIYPHTKAKPILRYRSAVCTCALRTCRYTPPMTCVKYLVHDPPTHTPKYNPIGRAVPEIQKRGLHVRTCRDTPPMTCAKHLVHDPQLKHQN